ncbi:MAG: hypothetical protein INQ03_23990 [Candidatus Heimdallarchaeota archaeon]|nr:hypothetical protein [Candidatus Heimdallarchaeota archaeon]
MGLKSSLSLTFLLVFLITVPVMPSTVSSSYIEINFQLRYLLESGNRQSESYALYLKQALAPLGIDVKIESYDHNEFVDELIHPSSLAFDITILSYDSDKLSSQGDMTKLISDNLGSYYSSDQYWGRNINHLDDPEWQTWQLQDTGLDQNEENLNFAEFDAMTDGEAKITAFESLNDGFFSNQLYSIPLIVMDNYYAMWNGFGGENNDLWDVDEGILESTALGATWNNDERVANSTHLNLALKPTEAMLDPYQSFDSIQSMLSKYTHSSLISLDNNLNSHPDLAWNFVSTMKNTSQIDFTFFIRDNAYWNEFRAINGSTIPAHQLDGEDFILALDLISAAMHSKSIDLTLEDYFSPILSYNLASSLYPNDTLEIIFDAGKGNIDEFTRMLSRLKPLPEHILGGTIHIDNSSIGTIGSTMDFIPFETTEWMHWASPEGVSHVGPYQLVYIDEQRFAYRAREDYYFPNEWDVDVFYNDSLLSSLEAYYGVSLDKFAPHRVGAEEAYYWAFEGSDTNHSKPEHQAITSFEFHVIEDINNQLIQFEAGEIDYFLSSELGAEQVAAHINSEQFIVKQSSVQTGPLVLYLNLRNEHLRKINVRHALNYVLDRHVFMQIRDGFGLPWYSIASPQSSVSTIQADISYSYEKARDYMRVEGYDAADSNEAIHGDPFPSITTPTSTGWRISISLWVPLLTLVIIPKKRERGH